MTHRHDAGIISEISVNLYQTTRSNGSRRSSVSIVFDYGLEDLTIEIRSPAGAKDFSSSLWVQTNSWDHSASYSMGTGVPFPGAKARPRRDADHLPPSSVEVRNG
jgi:hypothetical protein